MPSILDLYCGGGGAAEGYRRAGFDEILGVDVLEQASYPFKFLRRGALGVLEEMLCSGWRTFDAIHASPPCQAYSQLASMHPERSWPDLIEPTRHLLRQLGVPYVIENVVGAPLSRQPDLFGSYGVELCGSMFGLGVERGYLRRHRLFETSFPVPQPSCAHRGVAVGVYGHGGHTGKRRMLYRREAAEALDIDWMNRDEMTQAIPPAYTESIGRALLEHLDRKQEPTDAKVGSGRA